MGIVFDRPLGAIGVTVTVNGEVADDGLDLTQDGEFVRDGQLIEYFGFANESGDALDPKTWDVQCEWQTRADTTVRTACTIERR